MPDRRGERSDGKNHRGERSDGKNHRGERSDGKNRRGDRGRHQARKRAVDLLFEAEARGITPAEVVEARNALTEKESDVSPLNPYTVTVARGVTETSAHIDDLIAAHLQGWTLQR